MYYNAALKKKKKEILQKKSQVDSWFRSFILFWVIHNEILSFPKSSLGKKGTAATGVFVPSTWNDTRKGAGGNDWTPSRVV